MPRRFFKDLDPKRPLAFEFGIPFQIQTLTNSSKVDFTHLNAQSLYRCFHLAYKEIVGASQLSILTITRNIVFVIIMTYRRLLHHLAQGMDH